MTDLKICAANEAIDSANGAIELAKKLLGEGASKDEIQKMGWRISKWRINGVPPTWVLHVEKITGVSKHKLSPKLYPLEAA